MIFFGRSTAEMKYRGLVVYLTLESTGSGLVGTCNPLKRFRDALAGMCVRKATSTTKRAIALELNARARAGFLTRTALLARAGRRSYLHLPRGGGDPAVDRILCISSGADRGHEGIGGIGVTPSCSPGNAVPPSDLGPLSPLCPASLAGRHRRTGRRPRQIPSSSAGIACTRPKPLAERKHER